MSPTFLVLAAGIGSRYGGLKQMDPIGPSGEFIIDYSVYDAIRAGFRRVIFLIREDMEHDFRASIGDRVERHISVEYMFQSLQNVPPGFVASPERKKPWGTGHAVLVCEALLDGPFGVVNADDFYGRESYTVLAEFLARTASEPERYGMVGFTLRNTLSEHGSVSRGVCSTDAVGRLGGIREMSEVQLHDGTISAGPDTAALTGEEYVSMNMWGFKPSVFTILQEEFAKFLQTRGEEDAAELYLPDVVQAAIESGAASVDILPTSSPWLGMTNPRDRGEAMARIKALVDAGEYPVKLWG